MANIESKWDLLLGGILIASELLGFLNEGKREICILMESRLTGISKEMFPDYDPSILGGSAPARYLGKYPNELRTNSAIPKVGHPATSQRRWQVIR